MGSSSGEEDGDANWRASIDSAATAVGISAPNGHTKPENARTLKLYQLKAQKALDDLLSKSLEMVTSPTPLLDERHQTNAGCIRLFSNSSPGLTLHPIDLHVQPQKRPKIIPGEDINEKSKKFKRQLGSVAVNGADIMSAARDACQRSLSRFEARDAAARAAAKREEERVTQLKKIRGERWLPSIARDVQDLSRQHDKP